MNGRSVNGRRGAITTHGARGLAVMTAVAVSLAVSACSRVQQSGGQATSGASANLCAYPVKGDPAKPVDPPKAQDVATTGTVTATLTMAAGTVTITMDRAKAPCTVNNFESLVTQQYYDKTACHRLVDRGMFILQCGDPTGTGRGGPGYTFADELTGKETYPRGTVAMANAGRDTNGSQFFLVWQDTALKPDYTVFGTMDEASINVIAQIASQGVDGNDGISPIADASITSVTMG